MLACSSNKLWKFENNSGYERWLGVNWNVPASAFPNGQRTQSVTVPLVAHGTKFLSQSAALDVSLKRRFTLQQGEG